MTIIITAVISRGDRNFSSPACLTACLPASLLPACLVVNKWICRMKVTSPQFEIEKVYNHCCKMKWNPELLQKLDSSQNAEQNPSLPKRSTAVSSLTAREKGVGGGGVGRQLHTALTRLLFVQSSWKCCRKTSNFFFLLLEKKDSFFSCSCKQRNKIWRLL